MCLLLIIKGRDNPKIKSIKKILHSNKSDKFIIEGLRLCFDAMESGIKIKMTLYTEDSLNKNKEKLEKIIKASDEAYTVTEDVFRKISSIKTPQGILCVCIKLDKQVSLDKISNIGKLIVLENIQDPSNMGALLRTAEALGLKALIISNDCCNIYNQKVLRGSMGAVFRLPVYISDNLINEIKYLQKKGIKVYASVPDKMAHPVNDINLSSNVAIVIGNEGNGIKADTINICDDVITIPMGGKAESLNAAVAGSILMWEIMRTE